MRRLLVAAAVIGLLLAADLATGGVVRGVARTASTSAWNAGSHTAAAISGSGFFSSKAVLQKENDALREELARLRMRDAETQALREEVRTLRDMVNVAERERGFTAPIASSLISSLYGTFVVGAGSKDGVAVGDLVLIGSSEELSEAGGFVIGTVGETTDHTALVTELFAPRTSISGSLRRTPVELEGRGGGNARIEVPATLSVDVGDPVFVPEVGGRPVGVVGAVEVKASSAHKEVFVRIPVPISSLRYVYIVPL